MAVNEIIAGILPALLAMLKAPLSKPFLIWQLVPILCVWILIEFYFGTHKREKLGWNTALTNGISLFWIVISSMEFIFSQKESFTWFKFGLISFVALYALFIVYISFKHTFKAKVTFLFASPTPLFYFSVIVLFLAHDVISLTLSSLTAIVLLFIFILIFVTILKTFLPEMKEEDDFSTKDEKLDVNFGSDLPSSSDLEPHMPDFNEEPIQSNNSFDQAPGGLEQQLNPQVNQQPPQNTFNQQNF